VVAGRVDDFAYFELTWSAIQILKQPSLRADTAASRSLFQYGIFFEEMLFFFM